MNHSRALKHLLIATAAAIIAAVGGMANDPALETSRDGSSSCPQEMCVFLFDKLEEQSVRLRTIEDSLLRVVSILASAGDQEFSAASAALKSDSLLNSILGADAYDPFDSIKLFSNEVSNSLESPIKGTVVSRGLSTWSLVPLISEVSDFHNPLLATTLSFPCNLDRKKRQIEKRYMSPRERLAEALKWTKKSSFDTVPLPTADTMELFTGFTMPSPRGEQDQHDNAEHAPSGAVQDSLAINAAPSTTASLITVTSSILPQALTSPITVTSSILPQALTSPRPGSQIVSPTAAVITHSTSSLPVATTSSLFSSDVDQPVTKRFVSNAVDDLQSAVKCALAQLSDDDLSEPIGILLNPQAILNGNGTLTIQFELKSCQKYWQAVWIRIFIRDELVISRNKKNGKQKEGSHLVFQIPKECLSTSGNTASFSLPSTSKGSCTFPLVDLMECKIYTIEITPIYRTLQGQSSTLDITVPPRVAGNSTDLISLEHVQTRNSTHQLALKWSARSEDCARLMTSVQLRIYGDESDNLLRSFIVPTHCIGNAYQNSFSAIFSLINDETNFCRSIAWEPLDMCRKYKLEVEPVYSSLWRGNSSSVEIFTSGADRSNCCHMQTSASGVLSFDNFDGSGSGCTWLIVVEQDSTIWLTFTSYAIESYYRMKVYDGPFSTSPLLIEHNGNQPPQPIRSRSNKLFVKLVSSFQYGYNRGESFTARYISVKNTRTPYVVGCGGYLINTGTILKPAYPPRENSTAECLWYIESTESANSTLITGASEGIIPFPMLVYDGWSEDGVLLYNGSSRGSVYSFGKKALVKFPAWNSAEREREYSWNIYSMSPVEKCSYTLTGSSDAFSSHDGNTYSYSSLLDCRWTIHVEDSSNIRLTFVYFDIKSDHDFVSVYDGSTFNASLLIELSGKKPKPVSITSKSNQLLVRFTTNANSNDPFSYKGFLAFYATIPNGAKADKTMDTTENVLVEPTRDLMSVAQHVTLPPSTAESRSAFSTIPTAMFWNGTQL